MRIAVLADIHANVWALEAVLADVRKLACDAVWNLGDIVNGALRPRATYELLRAAGVALTIRGNQDRELDDWMIRDLGAEAMEWLGGLPATALYEDQVLLCHGSPADDTCYRAGIRWCAMTERSSSYWVGLHSR